MRGDAVMVAGSAGTGKTILGLQYLVNGATKFGEAGLYVTFEELPEQIYRDALNLGWDLKELEKNDKLRIICTSPNLLLATEGGQNLLDIPIKEIHPRRIVIDSLSNLEMFTGHDQFRLEAYRLIRYLKTKGLGSLLLWESPNLIGDNYAISDMGLSFLCDAIILLRFVEIESAMKKAISIIKLRGSGHDKSLREFEITEQGIKLKAAFLGYEGVMSGSPKKSAPFIQATTDAWSKAFTKGKS